MAYKIISREEMHSFIKRSMVAVGTNASHAETLADVLLMGDYRGHFSHGLNRLGTINYQFLLINFSIFKYNF